MIIQILFALICNLLSFSIFSMEVALPTTQRQLLTMAIYGEEEISGKYPWEKYKIRCNLKQVCTAWNNFLGPEILIRQKLGIGEMHYLTMKNDSDAIIELDMQQHTLLEPDAYGFVPMHYAIGCSSYKALFTLIAGNSMIDSPEKYINHNNKYSRHVSEALEPKLIKTISAKQALSFFTSGDREQKYLPGSYIITIVLANLEEAINPYDCLEIIEHNFPNDSLEKQQIKQLLSYYYKHCLELELLFNITNEDPISDDFIDEFMENGASLSSWTYDPIRLFHHLCKKDTYYKIIERFLTLGKINVDIETKLGETGLHFAAELGQLNNVSLLLQHGANINQQTITTYETPLSLATRMGHVEVVKLLLKYNPKKRKLCTISGKTALDIAKKHKHTKIIELLS